MVSNIDRLVQSILPHIRPVVDNPSLYALSAELHEVFPKKGEPVLHYERINGEWKKSEHGLFVRDHILYAVLSKGMSKGERPKELDIGGIMLRFFDERLEDLSDDEKTVTRSISVERSPRVALIPGGGIYFCQDTPTKKHYNVSYESPPFRSFLHFDEHVFLLDKHLHSI